MTKNKFLIIFGALFYLFLTLPCYQFLLINNKNDFNSSKPYISNKVEFDILFYNNYWVKFWGGSSTDYGYGITLDLDSNIFVVGKTTSFGEGGNDIVLLKFSNNGELLWNRTWGGTSSDYGRAIASDSEGNIYVAGTTYSFGAGNTDMVLIKYDNSGNYIWNKTWGGILEDHCYGIFIDNLDYIYISGHSYSFGLDNSSDICVIKYNGQGIQQWNSTWGISAYEYCYDDIVVDNQFNIYIGGVIQDPETYWNDLYLIKLNNNGDYMWSMSWGGDEQETGTSVILDSLGNIYLLGNTYSYGSGSSDFCLLKISKSGVVQWNKTWGGDANDFGTDVVLDSCGNLYLAGSTSSFHVGEYDISLVKYTGSGEFNSYDVWGGPLFEECREATIDSIGNIYLVGTTGSYGEGDDIFILKYLQTSICFIPGYDILIFYLIIFFTVLILLFKRTKNFKFH
ncbi:MAG: SBBP repeat-containing protein [Candidatus Thorarchaeota archaeon]